MEEEKNKNSGYNDCKTGEKKNKMVREKEREDSAGEKATRYRK